MHVGLVGFKQRSLPWSIRLMPTDEIGMSALPSTRATQPATTCSTGFAQVKTLSMPSKPLNSATFPESASSICNTLCLVRRGAVATGLDFSGVALDVAHRLSSETGLKADFVQGTVDEAPHLTPGPFDLVFTTWGTICWLPDITVWAGVPESAPAAYTTAARSLVAAVTASPPTGAPSPV